MPSDELTENDKRAQWMRKWGIDKAMWDERGLVHTIEMGPVPPDPKKPIGLDDILADGKIPPPNTPQYDELLYGSS